MDLAITFHMGLCLRIPRNDIKQPDVEKSGLLLTLFDSVAQFG